MPTTILLMVDGLRPDALAATDLPHIQQLLSRSAYSLAASSVNPSLTLPCHMSIFHSVPPTRHGITTNNYQPMARPLPGLMEQARAANLRCYFFHNWEPLRDLNRPESLHFVYYRDNCYTRDGDLEIAAAAAPIIQSERPDFAFVYFGTVDVAGHLYGWMSPQYLEQASHVDHAVGAILDSLGDDDSILLLSDHGGHDRIHGTTSPEDMTILWMLAGPAIRQNHRLDSPVTLLDTAPTLARIMNVAPHPHWEGACIEEAFCPQAD